MHTPRPRFERLSALIPLLGTLAFAAAITAPCTTQAQQIELLTAGREVHPFFDYANPTAPTGLCPRLLQALETEDPRLHFVGIERNFSVPLLDAGMANGTITAMCGLGMSEQRKELGEFVNSVAIGKLALGVRKADALTSVTDEKSLALASQNEPVLVRKGTIWVKELRAIGVNVLDDATENNAMARMVAKGRARYFYSFDYIIEKAITQEHLESELRVHNANLGYETLYLWLSKRLPEETRARVATAFARLKKRGDYARLLTQYRLSDL